MKLILTGGFLGSGKTTGIANASRFLLSQGKKVAVITNDQGEQQVDTAFLKHQMIPAAEITNGCFCCQYTAFEEHVSVLMDTYQPDVIFAEAVGSCTDLVATLVKPLNVYSPRLDVVVVVYVDGELLISIVENRSSFIDDAVRYIFKKQMEEADLLIINKRDLLTDDNMRVLTRLIHLEFPDKLWMFQNSLSDEEIANAVHVIGKLTHQKKYLSEFDYDRYAKGERALAWFDQSLMISTESKNGVFITEKIISEIFDYIQEHRLTIGHLKFFIETANASQKVSFTTTSTGSTVKLRLEEAGQVSLLINARVQTSPGILCALIDTVVLHAQEQFGVAITIQKASAFSPGYPRPTHRITDV